MTSVSGHDEEVDIRSRLSSVCRVPLSTLCGCWEVCPEHSSPGRQRGGYSILRERSQEANPHVSPPSLQSHPESASRALGSEWRAWEI